MSANTTPIFTLNRHGRTYMNNCLCTICIELHMPICTVTELLVHSLPSPLSCLLLAPNFSLLSLDISKMCWHACMHTNLLSSPSTLSSFPLTPIFSLPSRSTWLCPGHTRTIGCALHALNYTGMPRPASATDCWCCCECCCHGLQLLVLRLLCAHPMDWRPGWAPEWLHDDMKTDAGLANGRM